MYVYSFMCEPLVQWFISYALLLDTKLYCICIICTYVHVYYDASLFQEYRFDQTLKRTEGIEKEVKLLFTSGIAQVLSSPTLSFQNVMTATNRQTAINQGTAVNQETAINQGIAINQETAINQGPAVNQGTAVNQEMPLTSQ